MDFNVGCYPVASSYKATCLFIINFAPVAVMGKVMKPGGAGTVFDLWSVLGVGLHTALLQRPLKAAAGKR